MLRHHRQYSTVFVDGSSAEAWEKAAAELKLKNNTRVLLPTILVLENIDGFQGLEDFLDIFIFSAILVTSTKSAVFNLASSSSSAFDISHAKDAVAARNILGAIEENLQPKQQVVTIVAMGGTGKTQTVLKFVSKNSFRSVKVKITSLK